MLAAKWQQILLICLVATIMLSFPAISFGATNVTISIEQHNTTGFNSYSGTIDSSKFITVTSPPTLNSTPTLLRQIVQESPPSTNTSVTQPIKHNLLSCTTRPCTESLGSFTFKDKDSTSFCRFEKNDGLSVGKFELKGCIIEVANTAASGNYFLRIVAINQPGAYAARDPGARSYSIAVNGTFRTINPTTGGDNFVRSNSCALSTPPPPPPPTGSSPTAFTATFCSMVTMTANADGSDPNPNNGPNTVNSIPSEGAATITVDSSTSGFTSGMTGVLSLSDGEGPPQFTTDGIPCGTTGTSGSCKPVVRSDYRIVLRPGDRLRLTSSGSLGFGQEPNENFGFIPLVTEFLGPEAGIANQWFAYAPGASAFYDCTPQPPLTNETRNGPANIPMKFNCSQATATTPAPVPLVVQFANLGGLPPEQQQALSSAGAFFTPVSARKFGDATSLVYNYTIPSDSKDCEGGSMRVAFGLSSTSPSKAEEEAIFLLGSSTSPIGDALTDFGSNCFEAAGSLSGTNLFQNPEDRTFDPSRPIGSQWGYTLSQVQNRNKNDFLVYVALIVGKQLDGSQVTHDQELDVIPVGTTNVGASISFKGKGSPTFQFFPIAVTQNACKGDLPLDGVRYRIIRQATSSTPSAEFNAFPQLQPGTCTYQANVRVEDIDPDLTGPTTYIVQILINGIRRGEGTMILFAGK